MIIEMNVTVTVDRDGSILAPVGLSTPAATCLGLEVNGADIRRVSCAALDQDALILTPRADQITLRYAFDAAPSQAPDAMFAAHDSRFTRAAPALTDEARHIVAQGGIEAMVAHVTSCFDYGHTNDRFYDDTDAMPQLCDITTGSCVDINAYLVASLRAAGVEAGYVAGYFIPVERRDHTTDMHCWVATREKGRVRHWDIAHHLKLGLRDIRDGINPKPGVRVAMSHSMGWTLPGVPFEDFKLLAEPIWFDAAGWARADCRFDLSGYDTLNSAQNQPVHA
ncbi:transglutaminase domain-containing protein [uncultured Tateyamaria sp.]|uniref:transglutaminase domain-containing protein n=1 Tax=uncultured Tateyamaria sp. TaxID=455651 RepID=UPI002612E8F4|nr:transglutaminase domain-containing protein [uncultured Tateyamaria sp.]